MNTPAVRMTHKKKYCKVLLTRFADIPVQKISYSMIQDFRSSFTSKYTTMNHSTSELKTVLKYAQKHDYIKQLPHFDRIQPTPKRTDTISMSDVERVIDKISDNQYKLMLKVMRLYPVRPCELRALKWEDLDLEKGIVRFRNHFSNEVYLKGRKSTPDGEKSELIYEIQGVLAEIIKSHPRTSEFVFDGKIKPFVSDRCLQRAWRKVTRSMSLPDWDMYEIRHARISEFAEQCNGDILKIMTFSGHTNPQIVFDRYIKVKPRILEMFNHIGYVPFVRTHEISSSTY